MPLPFHSVPIPPSPHLHSLAGEAVHDLAPACLSNLIDICLSFPSTPYHPQSPCPSNAVLEGCTAHSHSHRTAVSTANPTMLHPLLTLFPGVASWKSGQAWFCCSLSCLKSEPVFSGAAPCSESFLGKFLLEKLPYPDLSCLGAFKLSCSGYCFPTLPWPFKRWYLDLQNYSSEFFSNYH